MKRGPLFAGFMVLTLWGCAETVKPRTLSTLDRCTRCRRGIDDVRIGAELVDTAGRAWAFKTPKCLATYIHEQGEQIAQGTVYVTDHTSGKLIRAESAMFVNALIDRRTGTRDYIAFRNVADAVLAAKEHQSQVVDWLAIRRFVAAEAAD